MQHNTELETKYREFISENYISDKDAPTFETWQQENVVQVKFLIEKDGEDVFAYFPYEPFDTEGDFNTCYAHIVQHSACHPDYAKECKEATPEQYKDLKEELESIGYVLEIL